MKKGLDQKELNNRVQALRTALPLLAGWFDQEGRPLPWRNDPTPYEVLVSETMLQQTRIETVLRYFPRFLEKFPNIEALAEASEEEVLKCWEGLGYYSRARNLQKAAKACREEYGGALPETAQELRKLPGIGEYTAGAVASIAFGRPEPAVDGNVLRILARLFRDERDVLDSVVKKDAREALAGALREVPDPGRCNEALMELGELICLPNRKPHCRRCPLENLCAARAAGEEQDLPERGGAKPKRIEEKTVLLLRCEGKTALVRRPEKGLLAGLYGLPMLEGKMGRSDLAPWLESYGIPVQSLTESGKAKHIFTHVEWHMSAWEAETLEPLPGFLYADEEEIRSRYALPAAFRYFMKPEEAVSQQG